MSKKVDGAFACLSMLIGLGVFGTTIAADAHASDENLTSFQLALISMICAQFVLNARALVSAQRKGLRDAQHDFDHPIVWLTLWSMLLGAPAGGIVTTLQFQGNENFGRHSAGNTWWMFLLLSLESALMLPFAMLYLHRPPRPTPDLPLTSPVDVSLSDAPEQFESLVSISESQPLLSSAFAQHPGSSAQFGRAASSQSGPAALVAAAPDAQPEVSNVQRPASSAAFAS